MKKKKEKKMLIKLKACHPDWRITILTFSKLQIQTKIYKKIVMKFRKERI